MSGARITPIYAFDNPAEFYKRHSSGVLQEFNNESREVNNFNKRQFKFSAWIVAELYQARGCRFYLFFIRPGDGADHLFPREGESCDITLWERSRAKPKKRWEKAWEAERIENPAHTFGIEDPSTQRLPAFKVKVPSGVPEDIVTPMQKDPELVGDAPSRLMGKYSFGERKAYQVTMVLSVSSATKDAEIGAIDRLFKNPDNVLSDKQKTAFNYLMNFRDGSPTVNLFLNFPHLRDPMNNPGGMPPKVITMLKGFNEHQRSAYKEILSRIPAGVCIIPGGPGAGKTHWNLVVTAAIQSKNVVHLDADTTLNRSAKVLYILDINKPLDDTCNKIVKLYKSLGLKRYAVRLHGWHYGNNKDIPDFSQKFMLIARMNRYRRQQLSTEGCMAPSLDELCLEMYERHVDTRYRELRDTMRGGKSERLTQLVNQLYQDTLDRVDFIATTPVPAATGFNGMFKPDLVIFDESPHAREASTMVALAFYNPIAWIFSGDHRQTRPFIASDDVRDNPWAPQMLISMMERADRVGAIQGSLLINHRAYGGLQALASEMFYRKQMITGHKQSELFPPSVQHVQRFLERFLPAGQKCEQPRLIVYDGGRGEVRDGTSWHNPKHIDWVMQRVQELLPDPMFRQVGKNERGTILIISPYKNSYREYRKAIKNLPESWQARLNVEARCEARTIDTCQGGEADFVFLDMVRSESTDFTDDPNRLNVAITRARQGEVILMHPGMRRSARYLTGVFNYVASMGQVVDIRVQGQPKELAAIPNEKQAYEEHVRYQAQFDQERVAYGLEPVASEVEIGSSAPLDDADFDEAEAEADDGPQSIFAETFANLGLADYMRGILKENKGGDKGVKPPQTQAQEAKEESTFTAPAHHPAPVQSTDKGQPGPTLNDSRWNTAPPSGPVPGANGAAHGGAAGVKEGSVTLESGSSWF